MILKEFNKLITHNSNSSLEIYVNILSFLLSFIVINTFIRVHGNSQWSHLLESKKEECKDVYIKNIFCDESKRKIKNFLYSLQKQVNLPRMYEERT